MAPDINTLPVSPRPERASQPSSQTASASASRRTSMLPPALPASATAASPSASAQNPPPHQRSPIISSNEQLGVPLRHPRPLTAAELYLECEKEQEAVVNRLTRELTALRAQSASVASNASSTSSGVPASLLPVDISDPNPTHQMTGATHPTPSRRPRSSSSVSGRSIPTSATSAHGPFSATATGPSVSQASVDRAMAAGSTEQHGLSRQTSISASGTSTPARRSLDFSRSSNPRDQRPGTLSRAPSQSALTAQSSNAQVQNALQHVADTAAYRSEMEIVKAENDALRQRVRALERALRNAQGSGPSTGAGAAPAMSASLSASSHSHHQYPPHGPSRRSRRDSSVSDASSLRAVTSEPSSAPSLSGGGALPGTSPSTTTAPAAPALPIRTPSSSNRDSIGGAIAAWASHHDGGIGGVAPPRERSESQSTSASSSRRPIVVQGVTDEDVRVGESAASRGSGAAGR